MYTSLVAPVHYEQRIKASRFLAFAFPCTSVAEVEGRLEHLRQAHPDANHHCWAYRIAQQYRFSDDGEPASTAGRPMFDVLSRRGVDRVLAVVVRYFGGTKLGAGGLARAYTGTLSKALDGATYVEVKPKLRFYFEIDYALADAVFRFLAKGNHAILASDYTDRGVKFTLELLQGEEQSMEQALRELSNGTVRSLAKEPLPFA